MQKLPRLSDSQICSRLHAAHRDAMSRGHIQGGRFTKAAYDAWALQNNDLSADGLLRRSRFKRWSDLLMAADPANSGDALALLKSFVDESLGRFIAETPAPHTTR